MSVPILRFHPFAPCESALPDLLGRIARQSPSAFGWARRFQLRPASTTCRSPRSPTRNTEKMSNDRAAWDRPPQTNNSHHRIGVSPQAIHGCNPAIWTKEMAEAMGPGSRPKQHRPRASPTDNETGQKGDSNAACRLRRLTDLRHSRRYAHSLTQVRPWLQKQG